MKWDSISTDATQPAGIPAKGEAGGRSIMTFTEEQNPSDKGVTVCPQAADPAEFRPLVGGTYML